MDTLTYGRKKPEDGDKGAQFWDALADNAELDDAHTHDGSDSAVISSKHVTRGSVAVSSGSWLVSGTRFRKTVTVPTGWSLASSAPIFLLNASGDRIYPHYEKISNTSFYLYMPVNNLAVDCIFV
jgi:hypothetical protein